MLKTHCNQNKYVCKTYFLKQFSANFHTKILIMCSFRYIFVFVNNSATTKYRQCNVPFNSEDNALIKNLYQFKEYGSRRMLTKFFTINCIKEGLDTLLKNIWETGSTDHNAWERQTEAHAYWRERDPLWMNCRRPVLSLEDQSDTSFNTPYIQRDSCTRLSLLVFHTIIFHKDPVNAWWDI